MPLTKEFIKLKKAVKKQYLGKPVPKKYKAKYGAIYDLKEVKSIAYATAHKKGIKIDRPRRKKK